MKQNTLRKQRIKEIKIGATSGPYSDMATKAIKPGLEEKGYKVEVVEFSDYIQPNKALDGGDIDATYSNIRFTWKTLRKQNNMDLTALIMYRLRQWAFTQTI